MSERGLPDEQKTKQEIQLRPEEEQLLLLMRGVDFGEVGIEVKDSKIQRIKYLKRSVKFDKDK